jgi:nucleotide-binding universal stress UspA family protein
MRALIAVQGSEGESFFGRAAMVAALDRADEVVLAHVIDSGPRADLEFGRERFMARRPLPPDRSEDLMRAEEERARGILSFAAQALRDVGVEDERMREVVLRGKPNEALRDLAEREQADVIVVRGRSGRPGPHSLGKTARYVIDHAPGAALLVR